MARLGGSTGDLTMPKFYLEIELGSANMCSPGDVSRALERITTDVHYGGLREIQNKPVKIRDYTGNVVGFYEVRE